MHYSSLCTHRSAGFGDDFCSAGSVQLRLYFYAFFDGQGPQGTQFAIVAENRADSAWLARRLRSESKRAVHQRARWASFTGWSCLHPARIGEACASELLKLGNQANLAAFPTTQPGYASTSIRGRYYRDR